MVDPNSGPGGGTVGADTPGRPVNEPLSGSQGSKVRRDRLAGALSSAADLAPVSGPPPVSAPAAPGSPGGSGGVPAPLPGGLPAAIARPSDRPGEPVTAVPAGPPPNPVAAARSEREGRLLLLDALVQNPRVSRVTREWAKTVRDRLLRPVS